MSRLADFDPVACSVCLQPPMVHDHSLRYVDFEVAHEGPVVTRHGDNVSPEQTVRIPIDDLVICEQCLAAGAKLIGMEVSEDVRVQLKTKDERIKELEGEIKAKDRAISNLDYSMGVFIEHPVRRPKGAPKITGPETHSADVKKQRSRRAMAAKVKKTKEKVA